MAEVYLQVKLGIRPTKGGAAELVPPRELEGLNYQFVVVKDGAEEGIVAVNEEPELAAELETSDQITGLTGEQVAKVRANSPPPRLKQRYRSQPAAIGDEAPTSRSAIDAGGGPV